MIARPVLEACCTGAPDFEAIYLRYYPVVFGFACRRTRNPLLAEDIAAQTFLLALQAWSRYEDRGLPVSAWLCRIARNLLIERARRAAHLAVYADSTVIEAIPDPRDSLARWEHAAWIADQMTLLTTDHRRVLLLRFWHDQTLGEMANAMDRSVGATKVLMHRALGTLRRQMHDDVPLLAPRTPRPHGNEQPAREPVTETATAVTLYPPVVA